MALSKVAAMSSLTDEETNFLRFANLLIRIAPKSVRNLFDKYFTPGGLSVVLNQSKGQLESLNKKKILNKSQMDLLYPPHGMKQSIYMFVIDVSEWLLLAKNCYGTLKEIRFSRTCVSYRIIFITTGFLWVCFFFFKCSCYFSSTFL